MIQKFTTLKDRRAYLVMPSSIRGGGWEVTPDTSWSLQGRTLHASPREDGQLAKEVKTGRFARYRFGLAWKGPLSLQIAFRSNKDFSHYFEFLLRKSSYGYFRKIFPDSPAIVPTQPNHEVLRKLRRKEKATLDVFIDKETGIFAFYLDDDKLLEWTDPEPGEGTFGDWLRIITRQSSFLKITRLRVEEWNGRLPESKDAQPALPEGLQRQGQKINLRNGDSIHGTLRSVQGRHALIETSRGKIKVPLAVISDLPIAGKESPLLQANDVRAWFRGGGHLTFRLESLADGKLTGTSQIFGTATFDLRAFSRLEFNIHDSALEAARNGRNTYSPR